jgi:type II secretory pathway predicted ATPase ExeA
MYQSYWQLHARPFENALSDQSYYPSELHQGALLKLRYAVENRREAALLVGPSGSGKTLMIDRLRNQLPDKYVPFVHLVFPQMAPHELLAYLADELTGGNSSGPAASVHETVRRIEKGLAEHVAAGRHAVVAIDEAHLLADTDSLETIRLLFNFRVAGQSALTVLLVGQPSLLPALDRMPDLEQRLDVKCLTRGFTLEETVSYATHRLQAAGQQRNIFEPDALDALYYLTDGIARRINRLCDLALLVAFAEQKSMISTAQLESICDELVAVAPE